MAEVLQVLAGRPAWCRSMEDGPPSQDEWAPLRQEPAWGSVDA